MDIMTDNLILVPGRRFDLGGGFEVRRLLPFHHGRRMIGPFIFLDHFGPLSFIPTPETDIRPHPHIGLSTLTYLYEGRLIHRDNLGSVQTITPGAVNWMIAGKGVVHSERAHGDDYGNEIQMEGLQFWVALPDDHEDCAPSFTHYDGESIPVHEGSGYTATVVMGKAYGQKSPVPLHFPSLFVSYQVHWNTEIPLQPEKKSFEIAVYVLKGRVSYREDFVDEGHLAILMNPRDLKLKAEKDTRFILFGGEHFKTHRHIWWNFVSSSKDKIESAKKRWEENHFDPIPGETEFIPLGE